MCLPMFSTSDEGTCTFRCANFSARTFSSHSVQGACSDSLRRDGTQLIVLLWSSGSKTVVVTFFVLLKEVITIRGM